MAPVNRDTGEPSFIGAPNVILEAFRPGTEPQIGSLGSTIRIGSGGDTFGSGFFGRGDQLAGDRRAWETSGDTVELPIDEPALDPDMADADTSDPELPEEPEEEPEQDLDDGLY